MKILHIISGSFGQGGAERLVADLANQQSDMRHQVTIVSFRKASSDAFLRDRRFSYIGLNKKKGVDLLFPLTLYKTIKNLSPDVVHLHLPAVFVYVMLSLLRLTTPFVYTIHNNPIDEEPRTLIRRIRRFFIQRKKIFPVVLTSDARLKFENLYNLSNIKQINNGREEPYKTTRFKEAEQEVATYKQHKDTKVFISVGRVAEVKNFPLLVSSFKKLTDKNLNAILLIIGNIYDKKIKQECDRISQKNIYFLDVKSNVADYLFCADFFCNSSFFEGQPISIIEAMAVGLPILATNVGGNPELVKPENGIISKLDVENYADNMEKLLLLSKEEIENIKQHNIADFNAKYAIASCANEYIAYYQEVLGDI